MIKDVSLVMNSGIEVSFPQKTLEDLNHGKLGPTIDEITKMIDKNDGTVQIGDKVYKPKDISSIIIKY